MLGTAQSLRTALEGGRVWWVAPDYQRSTPAWRELAFYSAQIPGCHVSESTKALSFPGGGEIVVKTADDPQALRGEGLSGVVLDEAAYMKPEAWNQAIRPSLMDRRGWALFISTPAGKNWLWELFRFGQDEQYPEWRSWQCPSTDNTFLEGVEQEVEEYRRQHGDAFTSQEWFAEFLDLAALKPFREEWLCRWPDDKVDVPDVSTWVGHSWLDVRIGVDHAISKRDTANESAIVVVGQMRLPGPFLGCLFVLHVDAGHWSAYEHADKVLDCVQKYGSSATIVYYEKVAFQTAWEEILSQRQRDRHINCGVVGVRPDTDKLRRAHAWSPRVEAGRFYVGPGQHRLVQAMLGVPPQNPQDDHLWDLVDAAGMVVRQYPDVPAPAIDLSTRETGQRAKDRAAGYATKAGSALLPDQVPRPFGTPAGGGPRKFYLPHGTRLDGGPSAPTYGPEDRQRRRANSYSVRPSRLTTVKVPGRA